VNNAALGLWAAHLLFALIAVVLPVLQLATRRRAREQILALTATDRPGIYRQQGVLLLALGALALLPLLLGAAEPGDYRLTLSRAAGAGWAWLAVACVWAGYRLFIARLTRSRRLQRWMGRIASPEILALAPGAGRELAPWAGLSAAAGLGEEVAFRGFLLWYLSLYLGVWPAVGVTAAVFASLHAYQGRRFALWICAVGGILGALTVAAGSLWPAAALHAVNNFEAGRAYKLLKRIGRAAGGQVPDARE